jgi:acetoin utilization deacetylase AcuC-like enzyme
MLPFRLVYHEGYDLNFGRHVFPSEKYRLIKEKLLRDGIAEPADLRLPHPVLRQQLLLVHTEEWVHKLETGTLTYQDILKLEVPYSRSMVEAFFLAAGGTILAARGALEHGVGFNLGGGFHHGFPGYGEGFCAVNDVAVAIRVLQHEGLIRKALVIDCDVHHGNGTAEIFRDDPSVFTISLHQANNYPTEKPPSSIDVHLNDDVHDAEYLARLRDAYGAAVPGFRPDLVVYVSGSDAYFDDQLGGLSLTIEGMKARDAYVFEVALADRIPVVATLAGGYAHFLGDTILLHSNTVVAARQALAEIGWKANA